MKTKYFKLLVVTLIILVLSSIVTTSVFAKGKFSKIVISEGGLTSAIELTNPDLMDFGSFIGFPGALKETPTVSGTGYWIRRYGQDEYGRYIEEDQLRYYPATDDSTGYIFYEGLVSGSSEYDGHWFNASRPGETILKKAIEQANNEAKSTTLRRWIIFFLALCAILGALIIIRKPQRT
jgi:hypothetical protein